MYIAASRTVRVIGPTTEKSAHAVIPSRAPTGIRPCDGLSPNDPVKLAGIRIEPPQSEPVVSGTIPAANAAELPPEEPPGVRSGFHGLRVLPKSRFFVNGVKPNSGVLVLPTTIAPAARNRPTINEPSLAISSPNGNEPNVVAI